MRQSRGEKGRLGIPFQPPDHRGLPLICCLPNFGSRFYTVNGEKKWITNGMFADYFTVAVRTGGEGMGGISLLLLEKGMPGESGPPTHLIRVLAL